MRKLNRIRLKEFLTRHASKERTLDIGSGGGMYGYKDLFPNQVSVDIDPDRHPDVLGDAHALPFPDASFSVVLCTEVLEHLEDPKQAIKEMARVLTPGGRVILTTRFMQPKHDVPHDYWRFTDHGLRLLFRDWDIEMVEAETGVFSALAHFLQRISFQTKLRANALMKVLLLGMAEVLVRADWLVLHEFGDISKKHEERGVFSSGFYIVAHKR
jgi:SAM-dependent methyltransferase